MDIERKGARDAEGWMKMKGWRRDLICGAERGLKKGVGVNE